MQSVAEDRFVFEVEWFDQQAELIRKYLLTYYPKDGQVDMVSTLPIFCLPRASLNFVIDGSTI